MLRRLICRLLAHNLVVEVDWARMVGRYRCTRCGKTANDFPLNTDEVL